MTEISNNSILFIGLANEYCQTLESCANYEKNEFVDKLLKLLPRIYIAISDFNETEIDDSVILTLPYKASLTSLASKSVLFSTSTSKAFWMERRRCDDRR